MISIEDRKLFARAEAKAREIKPRVRMVEFGTYEVASSPDDRSSHDGDPDNQVRL